MSPSRQPAGRGGSKGKPSGQSGKGKPAASGPKGGSSRGPSSGPAKRGGPAAKNGAAAPRGGPPARAGGPAKRTGAAPSGAATAGQARRPQSHLVPSRATQVRAGVGSSRGQGRIGGPRRAGDPYPVKAEKGIGGEQVEGRQAVRELLIASKRKVHEIWLNGDLFEDEAVADILEIAKAQRVPIAQVSRGKIDARARSEAPQGIIAFAVEIDEADFGAALRGQKGKRPFLVAVDGVTDPGNLGAILRNCEGAGVDAVILPRHRAVHVTPTVAKASAGAVEHVPLVVAGGLPTALSQMRDKGIWTVGLDDSADRSLFDLGDLANDGICLVLGAEGAGLSRLVRERCDVIVSIPMLGKLTSLNVSAAAALAVYEVARHRQE